jgi:hypothetical protein
MPGTRRSGLTSGLDSAMCTVHSLLLSAISRCMMGIKDGTYVYIIAHGISYRSPVKNSIVALSKSAIIKRGVKSNIKPHQLPIVYMIVYQIVASNPSLVNLIPAEPTVQHQYTKQNPSPFQLPAMACL